MNVIKHARDSWFVPEITIKSVSSRERNFIKIIFRPYVHTELKWVKGNKIKIEVKDDILKMELSSYGHQLSEIARCLVIVFKEPSFLEFIHKDERFKKAYAVTVNLNRAEQSFSFNLNNLKNSKKE